MLISTVHNFIYLANPKTGTTSFERAFRKYACFGSISSSPLKHINYRILKNRFGHFARRYEIVTCVRDPLETLHSWYRYRQRPQIEGVGNSTQGIEFEAFLAEWGKDDPLPWARVSSSVDFVLDGQGNIGDLKIFRHRVSPGIHEYVCRKIGKEISELEVNVSPQGQENSFMPAVGDLVRDIDRLAAAYRIYNSIEFAN